MIKVKIFGHWYWFLRDVSCWDCFKPIYKIGWKLILIRLSLNFLLKKKGLQLKNQWCVKLPQDIFWAEAKPKALSQQQLSQVKEKGQILLEPSLKKFNCDIFCNPTMYYGLLCYVVWQQTTKSEKGGEERDIFVHHSVVGIIIILSLYFPQIGKNNLVKVNFSFKSCFVFVKPLASSLPH